MSELHDRARAMLALREKATPGPWAYSKDRDTHDFCIHKQNPREKRGQITGDDGVVGSSEWIWIKPEDAALIASAHDMADTIGDLLAENERLTNMLSERQAHWRDAVIRADAAKVRLREIQTENERLRADRDALHKMTRCQCSDDDACAFAVRAIAAESRLRKLCEQKPVGYSWMRTSHFRRNIPSGAHPSEFVPLIPRPEIP